jgi:hypothetical protein
MTVPRAVAAAILVAAACPAGTWFEIGDAGRLPVTGQVTIGPGPLDTIFGDLSDPDPAFSAVDVDLYLIRIVDPLNFSAGTVDAPGFYVSDPQLFLFDEMGFGIYMNDDDESGLSGSQSLLPAGHPSGPTVPGLYFLGIGWWNNEPLSAGGQIFSTASASGTNGPDLGAGGGDPLTGWSDDVLARLDIETAYEISLTGAVFAIPEPAVFLLVGPALGWFAWRRRRH